MSGASDDYPEISEEWLVRNVPLISFFCENDELYTMRFLQAVGGHAFGYDLSDFIDNKTYAAAFTTHPEDQDVVDQHAEQAIQGGSPVVSRYRLVNADGKPVQVLLISHAVLGQDGSPIGLSGAAINIDELPALHGEPGVLSECRIPEVRRPHAQTNEECNAAWVAPQLPVLTFFAENDEAYTVHALFGSLEELLGYTPEKFVDDGDYKPSSTVWPTDQDIADAYIEDASQDVGCISAARFRIIHADGHAVPVIIFARGARPENAPRVGVAGVVLDISHVPGLQGEFKVLSAGNNE